MTLGLWLQLPELIPVREALRELIVRFYPGIEGIQNMALRGIEGDVGRGPKDDVADAIIPQYIDSVGEELGPSYGGLPEIVHVDGTAQAEGKVEIDAEGLKE